MAPRTDRNPLLHDEFAKPDWADLQRFVAAEPTHHPVYLPHGDNSVGDIDAALAAVRSLFEA